MVSAVETFHSIYFSETNKKLRQKKIVRLTRKYVRLLRETCLDLHLVTHLCILFIAIFILEFNLEHWKVYRPALLLNIFIKSLCEVQNHSQNYYLKVAQLRVENECVLIIYILYCPSSSREKKTNQPRDKKKLVKFKNIDFPALLKELKNFNGKLLQGCPKFYVPTILKSLLGLF